MCCSINSQKIIMDISVFQIVKEAKYFGTNLHYSAKTTIAELVIITNKILNNSEQAQPALIQSYIALHCSHLWFKSTKRTIDIDSSFIFTKSIYMFI